MKPSAILWGLAALSAGLFVWFSWANVPLTALFTDEAYFVAPALRMALDQPYHQHAAFRDTTAWNGPPAIGQYVYAFPLTYLHLLIFTVFEPDTLTIRVTYSLMHLAAVVATALVARTLWDTHTGLVTFCLLCLQPSLFFVTRDSPDTVAQMLLLQLGLLCLLVARKKREFVLNALGGFALGAAVNTKIAGIVPAAAIVFIVLCLQTQSWRRTGVPRLGRVAVSGLFIGGFVVFGATEMILANLREPLMAQGADFIAADVDARGLTLLERLRAMLVGLMQFTSGGYFESSEQAFGSPLIPALLVFGIVQALRTPCAGSMALLAMSVLTALGLTLVPARVEPRLMAYFAPWLYILAAKAAVGVLRGDARGARLTGYRPRLVYAALLMTLAWDGVVHGRYLESLRETGGAAWHSRRYVELTDFLVDYDPGQVVVLDWGLADALEVSTKGRIPIVDNFRARDALESLVQPDAGRRVFIRIPAFVTAHSAEAEFFRLLEARNLRTQLLFEVRDRSRVLAEVHAIRAPG